MSEEAVQRLMGLADEYGRWVPDLCMGSLYRGIATQRRAAARSTLESALREVLKQPLGDPASPSGSSLQPQAASTAIPIACEHCNDGDGFCVFPYYGVAPHTHADGPLIGSTRLLPKDQWGDNFREDPECPGQGVYLRCPKCGAGEQA